MILMVPFDQISALDIFNACTFLVHNNHQDERNYLMSYKRFAGICFCIGPDMQKLASVYIVI